jgi:alpha-glucosidase
VEWWRTAAIYEIYPRSFQDSNHDGIGDLEGIRRRLDYLQWLGFDALWIAPFYPSPMKDFGYDVKDYLGVDPLFGSLDDFDRLLAEAHARGLRVLIDLVPNHTSNEHPWFLESRSSRTNPKRNWYVWRDPAPDGGPPNNWQSYFGGSAWSLDASGQYYLHQFLPEQPDLNYHHPEVLQAILEVMEFWLRRGVDGFRVDALANLAEDPLFRDQPPNPAWRPGWRDHERYLNIYTEDQPQTHEVIRAMRALADRYQAVLIGEVYLPYHRLTRYYGTPEAPECHMPFNFGFISLFQGDHLQPGSPTWEARTIQALIESYLAIVPPWGGRSWVLGNHDQPRLASRLGPEQARVAAMLLFTLPGSPTWYYGDELALPNVTIPKERWADPAGLRQPEVPEALRDPERTPMPWEPGPFARFSTVEPWLPLNPDHPTRNVEVQKRDPSSMLHLVRRLLRIRTLLDPDDYLSLPSPEGVLAYRRGAYRVVLNMTDLPQQLDHPGTLLMSSAFRQGRIHNLLPHEGVILIDGAHR